MTAMLLATLLAAPARAVTQAPYFLRSFGTPQSTGAFNANSQDQTTLQRDNLVGAVADVDCSAANGALLGATEKGGYIFGGSCTVVPVVSGTNTWTGSTIFSLGSTVQYSTTGWTYANSNVSTFTWTNWVTPIGGPDSNVIVSTYLAASPGIFFTNLPSTVSFSFCGDFKINATANTFFMLKLATNTVGDTQADTFQTGSESINGAVNATGDSTARSGCAFNRISNTYNAGDLIHVCYGKRLEIEPEEGLPNKATFDEYGGALFQGSADIVEETSLCVYNGGKSGPTNSPITGFGFYPPAGVQMTGIFKLMRGAQTPGGK